MKTYHTVKEIYGRNHGSQTFYKRETCSNLIYTEGGMDFAETLEDHWLIDTIISHLPTVIKEGKQHDDGFFIVELSLKQSKECLFEIFREGYIDGEYQKYIRVAKQIIPYADLPTKFDEDITSYKFYLIKSSAQPLIYTLLLPSEY